MLYSVFFSQLVCLGEAWGSSSHGPINNQKYRGGSVSTVLLVACAMHPVYQ